MTIKSAVSGIKTKLSNFKHKWRAQARRLCSVVLCTSLVAGSMPVSALTTFAASDDKKDYVYELDSEDLARAIQYAVAEDKTLNAPLNFRGEYADEYDELFDADGTLYELKGLASASDAARDKDLTFRAFVRIDGDIALDEDYEIDGNEQILFLLLNKAKEEVSAVIRVDGLETEKITVLPSADIPVDPDDADIVIDINDEEDLNSDITEDSKVTLPAGRGNGAGAVGGSGAGSRGKTEIKEADEDRKADDSKPEEKSGNEKTVDDRDPADKSAPDKKDNNDQKDKGGDKGGAPVDNNKNNSSSSDEDETGRDGSSKNDRADKDDSGNSGKTDNRSEGSSSKGSNTDKESSSRGGNSGKDDSGNRTASVSIHNANFLAASLASASDAEETSETTKATPSDAAKTIAGDIYEPVRLGNRGAVAFVTTAADLGLDQYTSGTSSLMYEGPDYTITVEYDESAGLPEDVELTGEEYDTDSDTYQERYEEAKEFYGWEDGQEPRVRLFDVSLLSGEEEIEPAAPVEVTFTFFNNEDDDAIAFFSADAEDDEASEEENDDDEDEENNTSKSYTIIHFGYENEIIDPDTTSDDEETSITFELSSFSDIMVLAGNYGDTETQYVILNIGNINGSYRDDSSNNNRYTGYRPWATITGYNGANYDYYGNGEGTGSLVGYGGFADDWRITAAIPSSDFDGGELTITLPCDDDLPESDWHDDRATFYIYGDESDEENAVSVLLPRENAYDYKLVGWINIGTGEYYSVKNGNTDATINADDENIFYADWEAASYDVGYDDGNVADTVETDFVTIDMFDYNELFNLYSTEYELSGTYNSAGSKETTASDKQETWTIGNDFHTEPLGSEQLDNFGSFIFYDGPDARDQEGMLGFANGRDKQVAFNQDSSIGNRNNDGNMVNISSHTGISTYDNTLFNNYLFNKNAEEDGVLGVDYIGSADQLFNYGKEGNSLAEDEGYVGYYYYDSRYNSASYNQSDGRFYVYNDPTAVGDNSYPEGFFPYNYYGDSLDDHDGSVNYFFGMSMDVDFYLPNVVGKGIGNTVNGEDMVFNFSGDDDIWIFVDNILVLDMSGIHNKSYGSIDFCTGNVTLKTTDTAGNIVYEGSTENGELSKIDGFNDDSLISPLSDDDSPSGLMAAGEHTLRVYYLERGGDASNLIVSFNIAPRWFYESDSDSAGTVSVSKAWQDENGNTLEGTATKDCPDVTMGLYEVDEEGNETLVEMPKDAYGNFLFENPVTLSYDADAADYGWNYTWEMLDAEKVDAGSYTVEEINIPDGYNLIQEDSEKSAYSYYYWSIVGETEIEDWLQEHEDVDTSTDEYPRYEVILTDAASDDSEDVSGKAVYIDTSGGNPSIKSRELAFSRHPEEVTVEDPDGFEITTGIYGLISDAEVSACDPSVIWYLEYAEVPVEDVLDVFHICYEADGTTYYLAVQYSGEEGSAPELVISTVKDQSVEDGYYDEFYCDELGELRLYNLQYRLVISSDGSISVAAIDQDHYEHNNIKIYTLTTIEDAPYYSWNMVNRPTSEPTPEPGPTPTPDSGGSGRHSSGGGGGSSSSGGSTVGGPGDSGGEGYNWDLLPLPQTGQGNGLLFGASALAVSAMALILLLWYKRRTAREQR